MSGSKLRAGFRPGVWLGLVLGLLILTSSTFAADKIVQEYNFERPEVNRVIVAGEMFDRIVMTGAPSGGRLGQPSLPAQGASILLPYGTEVDRIEIITGEREYLGSDYFIIPVAEQQPLSKMATISTPTPPVPDRAIYDANTIFPAERFESIGTQSFRGYRILTLNLKPVEYLPTTGELFYYPNITVVVYTVASSKQAETLRGLDIDEAEIQTRVDNPDQISSYWSAGRGGIKAYDFLIITTTSLAASFQPLKDYHDTTGILTEIHTTTEVGSTDPDDVRAYILDEYLNSGIQYVLIGGDDDIIPAKNLYVTGGSYTEYNMPADVYFGCLDGTFNYDGDSNWGEPGDGEGGGEVDLIAEVFVGRAAAGNTTEAERFVTKTLTYLTTSGTYLQEVILVGEYLGFGGVADYAGSYLDELIDGSSEHGYTTTGFPSSEYNIFTLYERDWSGNDWPVSELTSRINNGMHIVNHLGHGSEDYAMKLYNPDVMSDFSNTDLCFVYSQTCLAGHLDGTDCWAETMNIKTDHGAFAVVMNARYGWGEFSSTDGASQRYDREFWDAVYNPAEGKPEIGRANHDSKEDNLYRINDDCMRWCYYELNLFGDPTIAISGVQGVAFDYPNGLPETVWPGLETSFEVVVRGTGDGVPVSGTGQLHYSVDGGLWQTVAMAEGLPNEYTATLPAIGCEEVLEYYISAEEAVNGIYYQPSPSNPNAVMAATGINVAFADDFETDLGWTVSGGSWARGTPTGGGGEYGSPDPSSAYSGANVFGYNLSGDYENSMPERHITSPAFDCSGMSQTSLKFYRWLGVEQPSYDHAYVRISTDGSTWTTIWENTGQVADAAWTLQEFDISAIADNESTVYLRFTQGTSDGSWRFCGWNIDDLEVSAMECIENRPYILTETLPDWTQGVAFAQQLEATGGTGTLIWEDKYGDLAGTGLTIGTDGLISGTPTVAAAVSFTAKVTDEDAKGDEQLFTFTVNPAIQFVTATIPDRTLNAPYSMQLVVSGGTGAKTVTDKNGDLDGTGLSLSISGLLTGTPTAAGPISFTALAGDQVGAAAERQYDFVINPQLLITTATLPEGDINLAYSEQLEASGGTGSRTWVDKSGDLGGTGLALSTAGLISGTPADTGTITFTARVVDVGGGADEQIFSIIVTQDLKITTESLSDWTQAFAMNQSLAAVGGSGARTWLDKYGELDATGLTISAEGMLTGAPVDTGMVSFTAVVTDTAGTIDEKALSFVVNPTIEISAVTLPDWTVGLLYSQAVTAHGGTGALTFSDKNGDLAGTDLHVASVGMVSGIPTAAGPLSLTLLATDAIGASDEVVLDFEINPAPEITTTTLPDWTVNIFYSQQLAGVGGTGATTFEDKNDQLVGTGLTLSESGLLSGVPTIEGPVSFTAVLSDEIGVDGERALSFTINPAVAIATESLPDWTVGAGYSQQLAATGGSGVKVFSDLSGDLEGTGLTLSATGLVSGVPATAGPVSFTAKVIDAAGSEAEKPYAITINPAVAVSTEDVPNGVIDEPFSCQLTCTGGTGTLVWIDKDGSLDGTGLTLSAEGLLAGTPTAIQSISFTAEVSDPCGSSGEKLLNFEITRGWICGDINGDGLEEMDIADLVYLVDYMFADGPEPPVMDAADVDGSGGVLDVADLVWVTDYMFSGGPAPDCP